MDTQLCKNCRYFIQHYALRDGKLFRVHYGHCIANAGRTAAKRPDTKMCKDFMGGDTDTDAFVTKKFLTKKLLCYMTELELLPENIGWDKDK